MERLPQSDTSVVVCYEQGSARDVARAENAGIPVPFDRPCQAALPFGREAYTCAAAGVTCELLELPDTLPRE